MTERLCVNSLIAAYGGVSAMSRSLGHAHASTVQSWKARGAIPRWRIHEIRMSALASYNFEVQTLLDTLERHMNVSGRHSSDLKEDFCAPSITYNVNSDAEDERNASGCKFISGDPKGDWSYCGAECKPGSSYCPDHHAKCYRTVSANTARRAAEDAQKEADACFKPNRITIAPLLDRDEGEALLLPEGL